MADNKTPPPDPSAKKDGGEEGTTQATQAAAAAAADKTNEQQQQQQQEQKPGEEGANQDPDAEKEKVDKRDRFRKKAKEEKPDIPEDFFYDAEELKRPPDKTDDSLPDELLILYHSFGYPCQMRNNLIALPEGRLVFSAGCYLQILYMDPSGYRYEYMRTVGGDSIGAITLHPSGKYLAVGEKGNNPDVNIYTCDNFRLYRILRLGTVKAFTSLSFNNDGDLMASQGGDPDHMLTVWNWMQETILLRCKAFSQDINHVSFNRELNGALCTAGSGHIKFWNMARTFTGLKLQGQVGRFGRTQISDIEGFLEFPDGKVLTGSDWGYLLLWDENLIKLQIGRKGGKTCHEGQVMQMMMVEGEIITAGKDGYVRSWNFEIIDMLEVSEESGLVELDPMNEVLISPLAQLYCLTQPPKTPKEETVNVAAGSAVELSTSPGDEALFSRHNWYCQDGAGGLWQADLSFHLNALAPKRLLTFHAGAIVACVVSPLTYLVMTLGEDGTLRLYDFLRKKLLAVRQFKTKGSSLVWIPICVDNHCATVLAGFNDGAVRRVGIDGSIATAFGVNRMDCHLALLQVIKPHSAPVTSIAYSVEGISSQTGRVSSLATCSEDRTIFFFNVYADNVYQPICYVPLQSVPRFLMWSPDQNSHNHVLISCDDGEIMEMVQPDMVITTDTLEYHKVRMRAMKFVSIKSQLLHQLELDKEREEEEKQQKVKDAHNKLLLENSLETLSQQNLRIESENITAAAEHKNKEKNEEPWEPYIPATPSPILQTVYEGGGKVWLMMGAYDSGYFYECQFKGGFKESSKEMPVKPMEMAPQRAIPMEDGADDVITAFCFISDGSCVFLGLQNGCIRVQFLETEFDLSNHRMYWSMAVHDGSNGAILGLQVSHDEVFLLSVGEDGNFFVFTLLAKDMLQEVVKEDQADIPMGLPEPQVEDIPPDHYTIEQSKQRSDQELLIKLAEKRKQEKRIEIASLRAKYRHLVNLNSDLPEQHRLTQDEFVMDPNLAIDAAEEKNSKLELMQRQLAWETEKAELGYKKLYDYYRKFVHTDYFCVRALATDHVIHSYRLEKRHYRPSAMGAFRSTALRHDIYDSEESTKTDTADEAEIARLLGTSPELMENIMGASERTMHLLKKVHAKRVKRAKRKLAWRKFMDTKPADDVEDPHDLEDIQRAKTLLGDRPLKSDSSYVVPSSYRLTMLDGGKRLDCCQTYLQRMQLDFNRRLFDLREEKVQAVEDIKQRIQRLQKVHDRLDMTHYQIIPKCPALAPDEYPGGQFEIDSATENLLKRKAREMRRQRADQQSQQENHREAAVAAAQKARRKSSVAIAKENLLKRLRSIEIQPTDVSAVPIAAITDATPESQPESLARKVSTVDERQHQLFQSPLWQEMKDTEQIQLEYEQSILLKEIKDNTMVFDIHHRQLRHEKFEMDVQVKLAGLRVTTLQEEQLLLMECEHVEMEIQSRIDAYLDQRVDLDKSLKQLQIQVSRLTKDIEENGKKDKALYAQLDTIIGDNNSFRDYLVRVYKKRVKRKTAAKHHDDTEGSESSDSDSDSSEDDEESEEEDDNAIPMDLNICPPKCSEEIYNQVIQLREQRLDGDEQTADMKKTRESVTKDIETFSKKHQGLDLTLSKAEKELSAFQLEKQKRMNDLYAVCTIQLHQIQCLRHNGEFHTITDELILSEEELLRLQSRILELREEKKDEKKRTIERKRLHLRLKHEKYLFGEKLAEIEELCNKEMMKKFGQLVDLEVVETVVADPQVLDARSRLINVQRQSDVEQQACGRQIADLKRSNINSLRRDTETKLVEAHMKSKIVDLEKSLDAHLTSRKNSIYQGDPKLVPKDLQDIMDVIAEQRKVIRSLLIEIQYLQGGPTPSAHDGPARNS